MLGHAISKCAKQNKEKATWRAAIRDPVMTLKSKFKCQTQFFLYPNSHMELNYL